MNASKQCADFIKGWEACRLTPYLDQGGKWTVGWGHLMQQGDPIVPITQSDADALFDHELFDLADRLGNLIAIPLSQQRFDGCSAFSYNCGLGAFAASTLRAKINAADFASASDAFELWNKVRDPETGLLVVSAGLTKRRAAERAIFVNGDYSGRP